MKFNFIKNIFIFIFSMLGVLFYFKILTYYIDVDVLSEYFKIKALGLILYYICSFRYSEFAYILKAQNNYKIKRLENIFGLYSFYVLIISFILLMIFNIYKVPFEIFLISYLVFLLNDLVDSYVAIYRLYHKYLFILLIKLVLIIKPLVFYILLDLKYFNTIDFETIFIYELYFHFSFSLFIFLLIIKNIKIQNLFFYKKVYFANIDNIKNTWLGSISKIPYEALPTYLLSFFISPVHFVEYNIARKVYSMIIYANQPFLQVLNTLSTNYKSNFKKYISNYYIIIFSLNIVLFILLFNFGDYFITFLSNEIYATKHTLIIVTIIVSVYLVYILIYPFRQYIVLNNYLIENNKATIISIYMMFFLVIIFIPLFKTYAIAIIQPLGLILPLFISFIILRRKELL